uniref:CS domain-containing protein n=1 Tax=Peromyscus maniculatus bairdii TaxID=230844 RepID=A0A8C8W6T4_PERMB
MVKELTKALEQDPDDTQYYCQRAYCHILLGKYRDGIADVKKSLELNPNNPTAFLRKGMCEYHEKDYASALDTFETQNRSESEVSYQTESQVIITLMIKNIQKSDVNVEFSEKELSALVKLLSGEDYNLKLRLLHPVVLEQSTFKVLSTKIEIKMKKPVAVRWEELEARR